MPTIIHFEIPSDNVERTKKFYSDLFEWTIEKWPGAEDRHTGGYWLVNTTDAEGNKAITGGIMKRQGLQGITNHFDVKSVQEYSAKVEKLGGKIITPKTPAPGVGYFAICQDTENNVFSIFEPDNTANEYILCH